MKKKRFEASLIVSVLAISLVLVAAPSVRPSTGPTRASKSRPARRAAQNVPPGLRLSSAARASRFAREYNMGAVNEPQPGRAEISEEAAAEQAALEAGIRGLEQPRANSSRDDAPTGAARQANADWNTRPQNETSIAVHPSSGQWVIGANDLGIGRSGSLFSANFNNSFFGFGFIGDYIGMTMDRFGTFYPAWTSVKVRKFDSDIFAAVVAAIERGD